MARALMAALTILAVGLHGQAASAGAYADDLTKCLVKSSSNDDQVMLVQWLFAAASLHPAVQPLSSVTPQQRDALDRKAAALLQRLMVDACRGETINALKYEGSDALQVSFQVLGQVAGRGLMGESHVTNGLQHGIATYFDKNKLAEVVKAAGLPPPKSP
jgi:hypothetical protein